MTKTLLADPTRTFEGVPFNVTLTTEQALHVWVRLMQHYNELDPIGGDDARPELMVKGMDSDNREDADCFDGIDVTGDSLSGLLDGDWYAAQIWEGTYYAGPNDTTAVYGRLSGRDDWFLLGFGTAAEAQTIGDDWRMDGFQSSVQGMQKQINPETLTLAILPGASIAHGLSK